MIKVLRKDVLFFILILSLGLILRLDFLIPNNFVIDSDEAIVGLMAKHINEGADIPVFYYGQSYMGSLEAILVSASFKIFGINNFALKLVPLLFSLALIVVVYLIGFETGSLVTARIAGLLCALPPNALVVWSAKARGGFIEIIFIIALCLLLAMRWLKPEGQKYSRTVLLGLFLGLGWWVNNQIVFVIVPIAGLFFLRLICDVNCKLKQRVFLLLKHGLLGLCAFIIGGLPFWIYNIQHNFASFGLFGRAPAKEIWKHFNGMFEYSLPMLFGAKQFWEMQDSWMYSSTVYYVFYILAFSLVIFFRRQQIVNLCKFQLPKDLSIELLIAFILATTAIFSISSFGWLVQAPRYLLSLYIPFFVLLAFALTQVLKFSKILGTTLIGSFIFLNLLSSYHHGRIIPGEPYIFKQERVSPDHTELIDWLKAKNINWVRTNYWIGYRLAFETLEAVKFDLFQEPSQVRIKSYEDEAIRLGVETMPFVLVPAQYSLVSKALQTLGYDFKAIDLSGYKVIYDISSIALALKIVPPADYEVEATYNNQAANLAKDGDLHTRWGSAHRQSEDMKFIIKFNNKRYISGLRYHLGDWYHDWPRGLMIEVENEFGQIKKVFDNADYIPLRYFLGDNEAVSAIFPEEKVKKIIISQTNKDPVFDWSIAEINVLEQ
jgi:4-amino-4-deoxy-L-arabinose transferase-like glycosyltransferase